MSGAVETITCGFVPLTDCATLVAAHELGFAHQEGVDLMLQREVSWSSIRDQMAVGLLDAAHMLAPMPIAMSTGLSSLTADICAPFMLSANGAVVGVATHLADDIRQGTGAVFTQDARAAGAALRGLGRRLRIGVPWRFSMHFLLTQYWLSRCGFELSRDVDFITAPPPFMADALAAGEMDLFCVGEPWGSVAVEMGVAELLLLGASIWRFAPEKALGVTAGLRDQRPDALDALIRALHRAAQWVAQPDHRGALAEILARPEYVDAPAERIERALRGSFVVSPTGDVRMATRAIEFHDAQATFPWRSQAAWIGQQLSSEGVDRRQAAHVFRPDIYRRALGAEGINMPSASAKLEGALREATELAGTPGPISLGPDHFFDGATFETVA